MWFTVVTGLASLFGQQQTAQQQQEAQALAQQQYNIQQSGYKADSSESLIYIGIAAFVVIFILYYIFKKR